MTKKSILVAVSYYLPGYKSGGPLRSIANLVEHFQDEFHFRIITRDRDLGDAEPYADLERNRWQFFGPAEILHVAPDQLGPRGMARLLRETPHDLLYLNSFLSPAMTAWPLLAQRLGRAPAQPTIIAPRGVFSPGAIKLKRMKKRAYLGVTQAMGLYNKALWHASTRHEDEDIRNVMGDVATHVASDLAQPNGALGSGADGDLAIIFFSRISRKKNLTFALDVLARVRTPLVFRIYGPAEDPVYWEECATRIAAMPDHIKVDVCGSIAPEDAPDVLGSHDLMFLPTLGENFGHVIPEALAVGTPTLISKDTTPWQDFETHGVGADLPLNDMDAFVAYIEDMATRLAEARMAGRQAVRTGFDRLNSLDEHIADNRALFHRALAM